MIPIVFIPGWPNESIAAYTQRLALQTPGNTAKWGKIYATTDTSKAHYAICQDNPISIHNAMQYGFKKSQIIYIKREADSALSPIKEETVLLTYQSSNKIIPAVWWLSIAFDELSNLEFPDKHSACSAIVSSCSNLIGHRRRLNFINTLAEYSELDIDIFGRGHSPGSFHDWADPACHIHVARSNTRVQPSHRWQAPDTPGRPLCLPHPRGDTRVQVFRADPRRNHRMRHPDDQRI